MEPEEGRGSRAHSWRVLIDATAPLRTSSLWSWSQSVSGQGGEASAKLQL